MVTLYVITYNLNYTDSNTGQPAPTFNFNHSVEKIFYLAKNLYSVI